MNCLLVERDHRYEQRFQAQADLLMQAIRSSDKALVKAEAATEHRLESMNEFRATLDDYTRTLISRDEVMGKFEALSDRVSTLEKHQAAGGGGTAAQARGWAYLVGGVGLLFVVVQLFLILR